MNQIAARVELQAQLFPQGIPRLWCPAVTHFSSPHTPDASRIAAHLNWLAPGVLGLLVPGSTGEGWQMTDAEIQRVLSIVLDIAEPLGMKVLAGVLKPELPETLRCLDSLGGLLDHPACVGITICPIRGAGHSQTKLRDSLATVLAQGFPTAIYQLPQVTQNELSGETIASLAAEFSNFILFKDTSGEDRVALGSQDLCKVFLVRGSEQNGYARWLRPAGGPYDGFLLSSANALARQLSDMIGLLDRGEDIAAESLSACISRVVQGAFGLVAPLSMGNPFANANKLLDHCMAHGRTADRQPPPMLISGECLPSSLLGPAMSLLQAEGWLPEHGYCDRR
jgi:dihydrodipicolinate synthase/N-acetylneuraminate lyase